MNGSTSRLQPPLRREPWQLKRAQRGLAIVEAAIVLAVFLLLVFAVLDGGRMIYAYGVMSHAAREGVRYAVVRGTEADQDARRAGDAPATEARVATYVRDRAAPLSPIRVFTTWPLDGGQPSKDAGQVVEVRVEYDFAPVTPFLIPVMLTSTSRTVIYF